MLEKIKHGLVVSCQALPDEPLHSSFIMGRMALAAKQGGAVGIRAQSKEDIVEIKKNVDLPVIGIVKRNYPDSEVYITPTKKEVDELLETGCEMIALDATERVRPHNEKLEDLVAYIHAHGVLAMADCSTYEECMHAERIGFDCVSTTLCGYTPYSEGIDGPNLPLLKKLCESCKVPPNFITRIFITLPSHSLYDMQKRRGLCRLFYKKNRSFLLFFQHLNKSFCNLFWSSNCTTYYSTVYSNFIYRL